MCIWMCILKNNFLLYKMVLAFWSHEVHDCHEKDRYVLSYGLSLHSPVMLEHMYCARWFCGRVKRSGGPREGRGQPRHYLCSTLIPNSFFYGVLKHSVNSKANFFISAFSVFSTALSRDGKGWSIVYHSRYDVDCVVCLPLLFSWVLPRFQWTPAMSVCTDVCVLRS